MKLLVEQLSRSQKAQIIEHTNEFRRTVLPLGWVLTDSHPNCTMYEGFGIKVFVEVELQQSPPMGAPQLWLHLSASRRDRVPGYQELCMLKDLFIGAERTAIHVFPKASEHYNYHPNCLHLWSRLDVDRFLPDFRAPDGRL